MRNGFRLALAGAALATLVACSTTELQTTTRCPPLVEYDGEFQKQMKLLLDTDERPGAWRLKKFVDDYGSLRAQCRALLKPRK